MWQKHWIFNRRSHSKDEVNLSRPGLKQCGRKKWKLVPPVVVFLWWPLWTQSGPTLVTSWDQPAHTRTLAEGQWNLSNSTGARLFWHAGWRRVGVSFRPLRSSFGRLTVTLEETGIWWSTTLAAVREPCVGRMVSLRRIHNSYSNGYILGHIQCGWNRRTEPAKGRGV